MPFQSFLIVLLCASLFWNYAMYRQNKMLEQALAQYEDHPCERRP